MDVVAGVDSSTSATKVALFDAEDGTVLGMGQAVHPVTSPPRSEQDPADWWQALEAAMSIASVPVGDRRGSSTPVGAVSVAAQQHGLVALDAAREVIRPAKLWNDTESAQDAAQLVADLGGPQAWLDACGSVPVPAFTITKLAWLRRTEPASYARLAFVALPHDWLTLRLTQERFVTDRGDASGTGYWSPAIGRWRPDLLAHVDAERDWLDALPAVLRPEEAAGTLASGPAAELGLPAGCLIGAGTGDNMAAALGLGLRPGDVAISLGTSGTVFTVATSPLTSGPATVAGFADASGRFLPLVCTLNATKVLTAFARLLGVDLAEFDRLAAVPRSGPGGPVVVPYLDGERTPDQPRATGTVVGLRSSVTREEVARAAVEGVLCGLLDGMDALAAAGVDLSGRLLLIGGGARSPACQRALADLSGRAVEIPPPSEFVARGAAVQAVAALTGADPLQVVGSWPAAPGTVVEPDPTVDAAAIRDAYAQARDRVCAWS